MIDPSTLECPRCGLGFPDPGLVPAQPLECPYCGHRIPQPSHAPSLGNWIRGYVSNILKILLHPVLFFRHLPVRGGMGGPLAFALITHWVSAALGYLWHLLFGNSLFKFVQTAIQISGKNLTLDSSESGIEWMGVGQRIFDWLWGAGPILIDPFLTLFSILFTAFFVFVGARILVPPEKASPFGGVTYESTVRILCYSMAPALLTLVPLVGGPVSRIYILIVSIIGVREIYRVPTSRAIVIALFPKLVFLGTIFIGLLYFAATLIHWISSLIM